MEIIVIMLIAWGATKYGVSDAAAAIRGQTPARWDRADARRERRDAKRAERVPFMQRGAARRYASVVTQDAIDDLAERHTRKRAERKARYAQNGQEFNEDTAADANRMTIPERIASAVGKGVQRVKARRAKTVPDPVDKAFNDAPREEVPTDSSLSASSPVDSDNPTVNINDVAAPRLVPADDKELRQRLLDQCDPHRPNDTINAYEKHLQWYLDAEPRTEAEQLAANVAAEKALRSFRSQVHDQVLPEQQHQAQADNAQEAASSVDRKNRKLDDLAAELGRPTIRESMTDPSLRQQMLDACDPAAPDEEIERFRAAVTDKVRNDTATHSSATPSDEPTPVTWESIYTNEEHDKISTKKENNMGAENSIEATSLVNSRNFAQGMKSSANEAQVAVERNRAFMAKHEVQGAPIDLSAQLHEALGTVASLAEDLDNKLANQMGVREQYMANPDAGNKDFLMAG